MTTEKPEASSSVRDFAEKSLEQARGAVGTLLEAAKKTADTIQSTAKTADTPEGQAVARGFGFAQENIAAIFDFAQKIVRAPDLKAAADLQSDFVREQAAVVEKQVTELNELRSDKT
ncbi:MAG: phasin [Enterovirga sp.]|jgi:phasin|nr:phasin [Enterovirga sp.]